MVIQRIQSVYLLIAIILMVVFAFFPAFTFTFGDREFVYGALEAGKVGVTHINPLMLTLTILIAVFALIDIFLFKNLPRQMTFCFATIIIGIAMLIALAIEIFMIQGRVGIHNVMPHWALLLPVLAIIFLMLAHKAMSRDKKALRDADRLR